MFLAGQRWRSDTEPELGLGIVTEVDNKTVTILFPGSEEQRRYGLNSHPLRRVRFEVGDEIANQAGDRLVVASVEDRNGLLVYSTGEQEIFESLIADSLNYVHPEQRLLSGMVDSDRLFQLRYLTYQKLYPLLASSLRGFMGARIALIPHQYYVANQVTSRLVPRVLLGDEVGLGKTIEAGLIIHKLLVTGRAKRVAIVVPDSLAYQWFVEFLRKFNLTFMVINRETPLEKGSNPFVDHELCIISLNLLKGAPMAMDLALKANWDLIVVDEAHQLKWAPKGATRVDDEDEDNAELPKDHSSEREFKNREYEIIEQLAPKAEGLLLLTATPEQLGPAPHFGRLKILDHNRFADFDQYCQETSHYGEMAKIVKKLSHNQALDQADRQSMQKLFPDLTLDAPQLLEQLIDRHGTGRVYFRNTRVSLEHVFKFFPKRMMHDYALPLVAKQLKQLESAIDDSHMGPLFDAKAAWLVDYLSQNTQQKVLLICRSKEKVMALEKVLKESISSIKMGFFHSGLSLIARDRQAAYFADPEGAQILLCTEIGSEGRNFEFAHHLVLFDLPLHPDLLEQRIGRLDRIGQRSDIHIHVPFGRDTWEEVLLRWYHEGLNAFAHSPRGASVVFHQMKAELLTLLEKKHSYSGEFETKLNELIQHTHKQYAQVAQKIEDGRDVLVEANSFKQNQALEFVKTIRLTEENEELVEYLASVFDQFGVEMEELSSELYFIRPGDNMFIPYFPALPAEGMSITFSRSKALEREDVAFMTWDHPLVVGIMDLIISQEYGNVVVAQRKKQGGKGFFIEAFFKLQAVLPPKLEVERYLPPTLVRVLINQEGEDLDEKWPKAVLDEKIMQADKELIMKLTRFPKQDLKQLLNQAKGLAQAKGEMIKQQALQSCNQQLTHELERMKQLKAMSGSVLPVEIVAMEQRVERLKEAIQVAELSLDCFRFIV